MGIKEFSICKTDLELNKKVKIELEKY